MEPEEFEQYEVELDQEVDVGEDIVLDEEEEFERNYLGSPTLFG